MAAPSRGSGHNDPFRWQAMRSLTMAMAYCRCTRTRMAVAILVHLISMSSVAGFSTSRASVHNMRQTVKRGFGLRHSTSAQKIGASHSRGSRRAFSNGSKSAPMIPVPSLNRMQAKTRAAATTNPAVDRPGGSRLRSTAAFAATTSAEASSPLTTGQATEPSVSKLQVATFFFLWYLFNVGYNLSTKYTLTALPLPIMLAAVQLLTGVPYVWTLWLTGLRKAPLFSRKKILDWALHPGVVTNIANAIVFSFCHCLNKLQGVTPIAAAHTLAHLSAVVSIGAGAVGFVHIVKGAEPLFTSVFSVLTGSRMPWPVYLTLLPIIGGVGMASAGEISFSALAFAAAMTANASAASRSVLGKIFMAKEKKDGGTIDAGNLYAMMTMLGCLVLTPLAMALEGPKVAGVWDAALQAGYSPRKLINSGLLSGLYFYLYNEVSFYALNIVHPVTHALGNTLKRVVMITVSVLVLGHKFTPLGLVGCCTAICGVLSYSLAKAKLMSGGDKSDPVPVLAEVKAVNSTAAVAEG